jgi:hypothetical protein
MTLTFVVHAGVTKDLEAVQSHWTVHQQALPPAAMPSLLATAHTLRQTPMVQPYGLFSAVLSCSMGQYCLLTTGCLAVPGLLFFCKEAGLFLTLPPPSATTAFVLAPPWYVFSPVRLSSLCRQRHRQLLLIRHVIALNVMCSAVDVFLVCPTAKTFGIFVSAAMPITLLSEQQQRSCTICLIRPATCCGCSLLYLCLLLHS